MKLFNKRSVVKTKKVVNSLKNYRIYKNAKNILQLPEHILENILNYSGTSKGVLTSTCKSFEKAAYSPSVIKKRGCVFETPYSVEDRIISQPFSTVEIKNSTIDDISFQLYCLENLKLTNVNISVSKLIKIIKYSPKLKSLEINNCEIKYSSNVNIKNNFTLEVLSIQNTKIFSTLSKLITNMKSLKQLNVDLDFARFSEPWMFLLYWKLDDHKDKMEELSFTVYSVDNEELLLNKINNSCLKNVKLTITKKYE